MCCESDEHSHMILYATTKNMSKGILGSSEFDKIMSIRLAEGEIPLDVLMRVSKKNMGDSKYQQP